jgi:N-acetylglutamate synthase-like GNAT family acetyltransferase
MQKKKRIVDKAVIRPARHEDTEELMAMLHEMDSGDYLQETWPVWMKGKENLQIVALVGGRIAGCIHGRISAGEDAWAQGIRVSSDLRRRGIATQLIMSLEEELRGKGAKTVFGVISRFNRASLATVAGLKWEIIFPVNRRRLKTVVSGCISDSEGKISNRSSTEISEINRLMCMKGVPASRGAAAFFKRIYFSMTEDFLSASHSSGLLRTNTLPQAVAVLDAEPYKNKEFWVIALAGAVTGLLSIFESMKEEAGRKGLDIIVDSPQDPAVQALLDYIGFMPSGINEQYMVVKKYLIF